MKKHHNIPTILLCLYTFRLLLTGASFGDAIVMLGLGALYAAYVYFDFKKNEVKPDLQLNKFTALEEKIKTLEDKIQGVSLVAMNTRR